MKNRIISIFLIFTMLSFSVVAPLQAQDEGEPAMKKVSMFALGGAAAGTAVGIGVWMLDPLGPAANFTNSMMTGFAIGSIGGVIFGFLQLQKQAVFPAQPNQMQLPPAGEFGGLQLIDSAEFALYDRDKVQVPIMNFQLNF